MICLRGEKKKKEKAIGKNKGSTPRCPGGGLKICLKKRRLVIWYPKGEKNDLATNRVIGRKGWGMGGGVGEVSETKERPKKGEK